MQGPLKEKHFYQWQEKDAQHSSLWHNYDHICWKLVLGVGSAVHTPQIQA